MVLNQLAKVDRTHGLEIRRWRKRYYKYTCALRNVMARGSAERKGVKTRRIGNQLHAAQQKASLHSHLHFNKGK